MEIRLDGLWQVDIGDGKVNQMQLPGTLDENNIGGGETNQPIATRLTRRHTYEGEARITRTITALPPWKDKRVFLEVERARYLQLQIDGKKVPDFVPQTLSTPHIFEVTGLLREGSIVTFLSDNSYPGWPHDQIVYSSAATDETQTNWNGMLGNLRLVTKEAVFVESMRIYPTLRQLRAEVVISSQKPYQGRLVLQSEALQQETAKELDIPAGETVIVFEQLPLSSNVRCWGEEQGELYTMSAVLEQGSGKEVTFGIREFTANDSGHLALNGRAFFLRGEANCAEFPETGYPPMKEEEWREYLLRYRSYGVNCVRFHSHCPPEAAFEAADKLGMLLQPELSHWDPKNAFESEESFSYYQTELRQLLLYYANHPSFVMLTFGNELAAGESGHRRMNELIQLAHQLDRTRLFANSSNAHYGGAGCDEESDFYTSSNFYQGYLRGICAGYSGAMTGHINEKYPGTQTDYEQTMKELRKVYAKPVYSFEVGQFEVLPDFDELQQFQGVTLPVNLELIQSRVKERGLSGCWKKYVEATGELALLCYREEIEAALRTESMSGISLLGLQDFTGQGTALVGMMNSHLQPKPYSFAQPERFHSFFSAAQPLALLPKYTWEAAESLTAEVKIANYGTESLQGTVSCKLQGAGFFSEKTMPQIVCQPGGLTSVGTLELPLSEITKATRLELVITMGDLEAQWPVWVYPVVQPRCPEGVYETEVFDEAAAEVLCQGGIVYLTPAATEEAMPNSVQAQFSTDFWSVGTFPNQPGTMGQLIDVSHPLFEDFPTEMHTNWQWWPMATSRAILLPKNYPAIITELDSYAYLRPMAQLLECRCKAGRLLLSSMGLQQRQQYPEARALLNSIYRYLGSEKFQPELELKIEEISSLFIKEK